MDVLNESATEKQIKFLVSLCNNNKLSYNLDNISKQDAREIIFFIKEGGEKPSSYDKYIGVEYNFEFKSYVESLKFYRTEYALNITDENIIKLLNEFSMGEISTAFKKIGKSEKDFNDNLKEGVKNTYSKNHLDLVVKIINKDKFSNNYSHEKNIFVLVNYANKNKVNLTHEDIVYLHREFGFSPVYNAISWTSKKINRDMIYDKYGNSFRYTKIGEEDRIYDFEVIIRCIRDVISHTNTKDAKENDSLFNNFEQRQYDYDDLERKLLGW